MLPSSEYKLSAPAIYDLSWLNPTPHAIAVYASQPLSPVAAQHSLPSGRYPLLGPDFHRLNRTSLRLAHLFNHLVGKREKRRRYFESDNFCCSHIDNQLKLGRLHDRQIGWLGTFKDFSRVDSSLAVRFSDAGSIAHQAAGH